MVIDGSDVNREPLASVEIYDPEKLDPATGSTGVWEEAEPLNGARFDSTATVMDDGRVLVVGGSDDELGHPPVESPELFDGGHWTKIAGPGEPRSKHTATVLASGQVLVAGGLGGDGTLVGSSELFDPTTGRWSRTSGDMAVPRFSGTATLLDKQPCGDNCGKVLFAGGLVDLRLDRSFSPAAELFDPATGRWSPAGVLGVARAACFACPTSVEVPAGTDSASFALGEYHASMVGNPSGSPATLTGHDFAAAWDPSLNDGAGGYRISGYREPQNLAVGEGTWIFSYVRTQIHIEAAA